VEIDGQARNPPGADEPAEIEEQFLGAFQGEDRNDHVASESRGLADDGGQHLVDRPGIVVAAVAVGRLHDDVIGRFENGRVVDQGPVPLSDVARKDEPPALPSPSSRFAAEHGGSEDMAGVMETNGHPLRGLEGLEIGHGLETREGGSSVDGGVERDFRMGPRPSSAGGGSR
jgi:hypothetical protein